ncbi:MAG: amidohydrolase family protein [Candidatus Cloacimonetes bacterium]|nr:amidohydrolase family protein [Candidatus Cloacimonadota bacterium]
MEFTNVLVVKNAREYGTGNVCITNGKFSDKSYDKVQADCKGLVAYPSLINIHDHLVGNWVPKGAPSRPYKNTSVWVEELNDSEPVKERDKYLKSPVGHLLEEPGIDLAMLGVYKNIFSGVTIVQDHVPRQKDEYYQAFPIKILSDYQQGHSINGKNWWGGDELAEEMKKTKGKVPFIIHLAEGSDDLARSEFVGLVDQGLLKKNSILVHCTALTTEQFKMVKEIGASIAWCPNSNIYLLGTTLDIDTVLRLGINICLGTDSTLSGSTNLLKEIIYTKQNFPEISDKMLFKMVTENPAKALMLDSYHGMIEEDSDANLLLTKMNKKDPYENLVSLTMCDIELLMYVGKPIFGKVEYLKYFAWDAKDYYLFECNDDKMFVTGHPEEILKKIEKKLGYKKHFDYMPF